MTGLNLSEWALKHRSFTIFLMIVVTVAGIASYYRLGRNEDPSLHLQDHDRTGGVAGRHHR